MVPKVLASHINIYCTITRESADVFYLLWERHRPNVYHILLIPKQAHRPRILDNVFSASAKV